jgi:taurine dioxygenase
MEIIQATTACGAFVQGVDLAQPLSDGLIGKIRHALHTHGVLFFRDQTFTPAQQVDFGRRFGRLHIHPYAPNLGPELPEVLVLTETAKGSVLWHTDSMYEDFPPLGAVLHAQYIPSVGGDTIWASMCAAYDALSPAMQKFLGGLQGVHGGEKMRAQVEKSPENRGKPMLEATHPLVITDPVTGRKAIFACEQYTSAIVGLNKLESDALLDLLVKHTQKPEFQVRLRWEPKTVAFWCNPIVQHYPVPDYDEPRCVHRVSILMDQRPA